MLQAARLARLFQAGARLPERGALPPIREGAMMPLLRMLEYKNLSLSDAEVAGFHQLARAAQRCLRCPDAKACIRWLKWRGAYGPAPQCLNAGYFDWLRQRSIPD